MRNREWKHVRMLLLIGVTGLGVGAAHAADPSAVIARDIIKAETFTPVYQDDKEGRLVYRATNRSILKETTKTGLLDGLTKTCEVFADLVNGNGAMSGFCRHESSPSDFSLVEWKGMCRTGSGKAGTPETRCWGGWSYVPGGKGKLATLQGGGTWSGVVLASGEFDEEVTGLVQR